MTISYPINFPSTIMESGISEFTLNLRTAAGRSESPFSFAEQVYVWPGAVWEVEVTLPPMLRDLAAEYKAFISKLRGRAGTFLLPIPNAATPRGVGTGTILVDGAGQTGELLDIKGCTPNTTGILKAGDYINLGTGMSLRLYEVLQDADSDGAGKATLMLSPDLRSSPADGAAVTVTNPKLLVRMASNSNPVRINTNSFYLMSFRGIEALNGS